MDRSSKAIGNKGEDLTADYLIKLGYKIIRRNYISSYGEIDIIAEKNDILVFVEVKTRKEGSMIPLFESVTKGQKTRIIKSAVQYMQEKGTNLQPRFDVSFIENKSGAPTLEYIEGAFDGGVLGSKYL